MNIYEELRVLQEKQHTLGRTGDSFLLSSQAICFDYPIQKVIRNFYTKNMEALTLPTYTFTIDKTKDLKATLSPFELLITIRGETVAWLESEGEYKLFHEHEPNDICIGCGELETYIKKMKTQAHRYHTKIKKELYRLLAPRIREGSVSIGVDLWEGFRERTYQQQ